MTREDTAETNELHDFVFAKTAKVLGADRARQVIARLLGQLGIELRTPQDLAKLAEAMSQLGGFEGAVGAMLGVAAVLRGATPTQQMRSA